MTALLGLPTSPTRLRRSRRPARLDCARVCRGDARRRRGAGVRRVLPAGAVRSTGTGVRAARGRRIIDDPTDALADARSATLPGCIDVAVATTARQRAALWRYRDEHTLGHEHARPAAQARRHPARWPRWPSSSMRHPRSSPRSSPGPALGMFGHIGDGNIHVNITGTRRRRRTGRPGGARATWHASAAASAPSTASARPSADGCTSTEARAEIDTMRSIKRAFDPDALLNPRVLL